MKKTLFTFALVLVIAVSVVAGTLAVYTTTISNLATGSVVAKEFILLESGTDTFTTDAKIAPGESGSWQFAVKNFNGAKITETAMDLDITVTTTNVTGKAAIAPLTVTVKNEEDVEIGTTTGTGTVTFDDDFSLNTAEGQTHTYTVEVAWPSNDAVDINFAGDGYGSAITVSVTGTQA